MQALNTHGKRTQFKDVDFFTDGMTPDITVARQNLNLNSFISIFIYAYNVMVQELA